MDESPPLLPSLGYGAQFSLIASATVLVTPVIVARESGLGESYLLWMVFASLVVVGISTLVQARGLGPVGAGALLPMFTAAVSIPFCITAVVDGGPRHPGQPGDSDRDNPAHHFQVGGHPPAHRNARGERHRHNDLVRHPRVGGIRPDGRVVAGRSGGGAAHRPHHPCSGRWPEPAPRCGAPALGACDRHRGRLSSPPPDSAYSTPPWWLSLPGWDLPTDLPDLTPQFGIPFWALLPSFFFLAIIFSIHSNGETIAQQRVAWRDDRALDFRQVQGGMMGSGVSNLLSGFSGAVPNIINSGIISFSQTTGVASRRVGYFIAIIFIAAAFLPKVSGLIASIPAPVMTGYLMLVTGTLLVDGTRTVIQNEPNRQKVVVAGICFWIGASFHFNLFHLPSFGAVWDGLFKSAITTGGLAAIIMIIYLELTTPKRMRFQAPLHIDSLPDLNEFMARFASNRRWNDAMKDRLSAVAEETLLTLAPLDLTLDEDGDNGETDRKLIVLASSDGPLADLEFIGGGNEANLEDRIRQLQQHDTQDPVEEELSLRLLRSFAQSVRHQQYHGTDIITVRVGQPGG